MIIDSTAIATLGGPSWEEFATEASTAISDAKIHGVIVSVGDGLGGPGYPSDLAGLGVLLRRIETSGKPFVAVIDGPVSAAAFEGVLPYEFETTHR